MSGPRIIKVFDDQIGFISWIAPITPQGFISPKPSPRIVPIRDTPHYRFAKAFISHYFSGQKHIRPQNTGYDEYSYFESVCHRFRRQSLHVESHTAEGFYGKLGTFMEKWEYNFEHHIEVAKIISHDSDSEKERYMILDGAHRLSFLRAMNDHLGIKRFEVCCRTNQPEGEVAMVSRNLAVGFTFEPDVEAADESSRTSFERCKELGRLADLILRGEKYVPASISSRPRYLGSPVLVESVAIVEAEREEYLSRHGPKKHP